MGCSFGRAIGEYRIEDWAYQKSNRAGSGMGIENVRTRYCKFLKSGLVFHSKACNEKSTNTSENRDYNCRGQLLSRLLQHPVYTTWLAVLSGQSLQRKD